METIIEEADNLFYEYLHSIRMANLYKQRIADIREKIEYFSYYAEEHESDPAFHEATRLVDSLNKWYILRFEALSLRDDARTIASFHYELHADEYHNRALGEAATRGIEITFSGESVGWLPESSD